MRRGLACLCNFVLDNGVTQSVHRLIPVCRKGASWAVVAREEGAMNTKRDVINTNFVDKEYFLHRAKDFEQKYQMDWPDFFVRFRQGKLDADAVQYADYTEWAFICTTFVTDLINMEGPGPPIEDGFENSSRKPEFNTQAFVFSIVRSRPCLILSSTSISSIPSSRLHVSSFLQP